MQPPEMQPPAPQPPPMTPSPVMEPPPVQPPYAPAPYGQMPAPAAPPKRGRGPILAIVLIVALLVLGGGGYLVGGFVYAQGKINSATDTYNTVVDHQNKLTTFFDNLSKQFDTVDPANADASAISTAKTLYQQLVSQSQAAQPQITTDDSSLAAADASLKENSWLTVFSRSSLDKSSTEIGHARDALAVAKTIVTDYVQYGNFNIALLAAAQDLVNLDNAANKQDLSGAASAVTALKSDLATAKPLDSAPGLDPQMNDFINTLQTLAGHFDQLLAAVNAGDGAAVQKAADSIDADSTKLDTYDFTTMDNHAQAFYQGLIDKYNAAVDAANKS